MLVKGRFLFEILDFFVVQSKNNCGDKQHHHKKAHGSVRVVREKGELTDNNDEEYTSCGIKHTKKAIGPANNFIGHKLKKGGCAKDPCAGIHHP